MSLQNGAVFVEVNLMIQFFIGSNLAVSDDVEITATHTPFVLSEVEARAKQYHAFS